MEGRGAEDPAIRALDPGERLLWSGRPRQGILLRPADLVRVPFSLLVLGAAIVWEMRAIGRHAPWALGVPMILFGVYVVVGRLIVDALSRARTAYALGDRHAVIVSGLFRRRVRSVDLAAVRGVEVRPGPSGSGSIYFGPAPPKLAILPSASPAFELIAGLDEVHERVRTARAGLKSA